jgi:hypothetical protein
MDEQSLRVLALQTAQAIEGAKATTLEVLDAAQSILDFLHGVDAERVGKPN